MPDREKNTPKSPVKSSYEDTSTGDLMDELTSAGDTKQLDSYMESISGKYSGKLSEYLGFIMQRQNFDRARLVRESYVERTYVYQILDGSKNPTRDKIVMIALALKMSLVETQRALQISHAGVLYPKDERDSLLIYSVEHGYGVRDANALLAKYKKKELE